jgi:hypothetical protein
MITCRLTGKRGKPVNAHIIPKALTKPTSPGSPFLQAGMGTEVTKRWSSWYDNKLVVADGEAILSKIDTEGIAELRRHQLLLPRGVYLDRLAGSYQPIKDTGFGFREIFEVDAKKLRLFFLSLLWRASVSKRWELKEINLSSEIEDQLRRFILNEVADDPKFIPCQIIQISNEWFVHNHTPIVDEKQIPRVSEDLPDLVVPIIRFYFEGLIVHLHYTELGGINQRDWGALKVGGDEKLIVATVTWQKSFQRKIIEEIMGSVAQ